MKTNRYLYVFVLILIFFHAAILYAGFPKNYYPSGVHPSIWLSDERIATLKTLRSHKNNRWVAFQELCDSIVDNDTSNDPWNLSTSPQQYTAPLALMYLVSGDSRYADKALELVNMTSTDFSQYGDPDHEGYYYLGLTYDWLFNYSGMSKTVKERFREKMLTVSDKFWNEFNLSASGTDSDQDLLTTLTHLVLGIAMYGETPAAVNLLDRAWKGWDEGYFLDRGISDREIIKSALGGAYFTGMAYFPSTDIVGIAGLWLTLETACGYDFAVHEPDLLPFYANIIKSIIHLTEPGRSRIYPYGAWQDPNILSEQPWLRRALIIASWFADHTGFSKEASLGRGYAKDVDIGDFNDPMLELLYTSPEATIISPYGDSSLPLVRFAQHPDFMMFRDNWSTSAKWGVFIGDGSIPCDHQSPDHGSFALWRGSEYLTRGVRTYDAMKNGDFFNTLSIKNNCMVNGESCSGTALFNSRGSASILRHRVGEGGNTPVFAYGMLQADDQWDDPLYESEGTDNVITYRRHFFWAGDFAVIFDRLRTKTPVTAAYRLRALTEPSVNGDTVSQFSESGEQKLMQSTLEPSKVSIRKVNEQTEWSSLDDWIVNTSERKWQTVIDFPASTTLNILNVIQTGPSSMNNFSTMEHISSGSISGVRIGDYVVCFSTDETLKDDIIYSVTDNGHNMWHLVADMEPGKYEVILNGSVITTLTVNDEDNTALFRTSSAQGIKNIHIKKETVNAATTAVITADTGKITAGSSVTLSITLKPGITDNSSDWWLVHAGPGGVIESYGSAGFTSGIFPVYQGSLMPIDNFQLQSTLYKKGIHYFYFGVDTVMNGIIDVSSLFYDSCSVEVE